VNQQMSIKEKGSKSEFSTNIDELSLKEQIKAKDFSCVVIAFKKPSSLDFIYVGEEKIPFHQRNERFKEIMLKEFTGC